MLGRNDGDRWFLEPDLHVARRGRLRLPQPEEDRPLRRDDNARGPALEVWNHVAAEGPCDPDAIGPSCLTSAVPSCANDTSGVCFPFCSNATWKSPVYRAPGAVSVTSTVVVWPTVFGGFDDFNGRTGQAPGVHQEAARDEGDGEDEADEIAHR